VSQNEIASSKTPRNDGELHSSWVVSNPLSLNFATHSSLAKDFFRAGKPNDDLGKDTLNSIFKQGGFKS